jgi:ATP-binding cassette subfamily A (ABC1) protein 1
MDLADHAHKLAGTLSGGNKRKLCVAMALIGDPQLVLLDEPSAGMDPKARRFMWSVIQEISMARKQAAVILTTHSMEECEALCNRAVIMVNGQFRTIGTHVEIKRAYGQGRELVVKLVPPSKEEMADAMRGLRGAGEEIKQTDVVSVLPENETEWVKSAAASSMAPFRVQPVRRRSRRSARRRRGGAARSRPPRPRTTTRRT